MARRYNERYVRFYTFGSAAPKLEPEKRSASLPKYKAPEKRKPIPFDPIAFVGTVVAVVLAVLMVVGLFQVNALNRQIQMAEGRVIALERTNEALREEYESGYDLDEVRVAAQSMGMIPAQEAPRVSVTLAPEQVTIQRLSWWDSIMLSIRNIFA